MKPSKAIRFLIFLLSLFAVMSAKNSVAQTTSPSATPSTLPSEMPEKLVPVTDSWDYVRREVMIPILVPRCTAMTTLQT